MTHVPEVDLDTLRSRIQCLDVRGQLTYPEIHFSGVRRSAVLVPIVMRSSGPHFLLTQRSHDLRHQAGQVAFPGGAKDPSDPDELHAALREAEEEVGLPRDAVEILAMLFPLFVRPNFSVMGYVGLIPADFVPKPCEQEVACVFEVPLRDFVEKEVERVRFDLLETEVAYPRYLYTGIPGGEALPIWGATAMYCVTVAEVVYNVLGRFGGFMTKEVGSVDEIKRQYDVIYRKLCKMASENSSHL